MSPPEERQLSRFKLVAFAALATVGFFLGVNALVERAEILERLRDAQDGYNAQVEKINRDELADQLRGVSRAAQGVSWSKTNTRARDWRVANRNAPRDAQGTCAV